MPQNDRTTVTRRRALRTTGTLFLGAGLMGTAGAPPVAAALPPTIERAEALLLELEQMMIQLDAAGVCDVTVELDRLSLIGGAYDPVQKAKDLPRNTGENRYSTVCERGHALAHSRVIPQWGREIAVAVAARKAHGDDYRRAEAAEDALATVYADAEAADIERYGEVGQLAWIVARSAALFGYCEDCDPDA